MIPTSFLELQNKASATACLHETQIERSWLLVRDVGLAMHLGV